MTFSFSGLGFSGSVQDRVLFVSLTIFAMRSTPRAALTELFAAYGRPILSAPRILEGLLKDYCGDFRREIFVIVSCAKAGVPDQLLQQSGPSIKLVCARLALKLEQNLATSSDVARWAVESWAIALGLMTPEAATARLSHTIGVFAGAAGMELAYPTHLPDTTRLPNQLPTRPAPTPGNEAAEPPFVAEDEVVEALAVEPESRWAVPDWSHPETNIIVYPDREGHTPTLRDAVREARENTCILLKPGVYRESLIIKRSLQIRSADTLHPATIESLTSSSVVVLEGASLYLSHLKIKGTASKDQKILPAVEIKSGHLVMEDCHLTSEVSTVVDVKGAESEAILRRCHLHDGKAGGISFHDSAVGYLEECHLYRNKLSQVVIGKGCAPTLTGCKISHSAMAGIYISEGGAGLVEDCDIWGSAVGGIQCRRGGNPHVRLSRISMNERYGVLVAEQGEGFFERCQIFDNARSGVTVTQLAKPRFSACQIFDNREEGVTVDEQGTGDWLDCEIFTNHSANIVLRGQSKPNFLRCVIHDGRKEGVSVQFALGRFENCEFFANGFSAASLAQEANSVFEKCVFHDNAQSGIDAIKHARGKLIDCELTHHGASAVRVGEQAELELVRCHVVNNEAAGIEILENGSAQLTNCAVCDNQGGGVLVRAAGSGRAEKCDVTGNTGNDWDIAKGAAFTRS